MGAPAEALPHDHLLIGISDGGRLALNDPRRFGCLLWQPVGEVHPLLQGLGPEPLSSDSSLESVSAVGFQPGWSRSRSVLA